ncbi:MAG: ribonuclease H-like domain-containing protein [Verrucomicrobia bacterium]|nr:ribonuclease H-like domain-containing protein [Verrucomicrobiota bacterium]MBS0637419.1 ribonuclease H-like domain-containing protein [Verrucomicrobiota bacterium]
MAKRPIFFDTETTGVNPKGDRIVELAAYCPETGKSFERLINPGIPIPKETTMVHQITDSMVADAADFATVAREFIEFCSGDIALIAHNADSFDVPFLQYECRRCNVELPTDWLYIDSLKWSRRYRKDLPRHSLQFLRQTYGITANQAHRALNDVMVLYEVFKAMTDDLSCEQIAQLLNIQNAPLPMQTEVTIAPERVLNLF